MNGLYGYPTSPTVALARLGALAAGDSNQATIMSFINGDYADQLNSIHDEINQQYAQTDATYAAIQKLPDGPAKTSAFKLQQQAVAAVNQEFVQYRTARDKYNDIATQISTYSLGMYTPSLLSDFGQLETVMTVAAIAAIAYAISQLGTVIAAIRGQSVNTKGYLEQASELVTSAGGTITQIGSALPKIGLTVIGVAVAAAALYFGIKYMKSRGGRAAPAAPVAAPALAAGAGI